MNITQARNVPLYIILEKMGAERTSQKNNQEWYLSPLRVERTASFHVHTNKNIWYDFGEGVGGDGINLVCLYLERSGEANTVVDALRWLKNMTRFEKIPVPRTVETHKEPVQLVVKHTKKLTHLALKKYLEARGIPFAIGEIYLKEVFVHNLQTGNKFFALGLHNEDGGCEVRNPFFKGCVAPKTITFIRGSVPKPASINVFEGIMDFLSVLVQEKKEKLDSDSIILNSVTCVDKALPYIENYGYTAMRSWLDNDVTGKNGADILDKFARTQKGLKHKRMNEVYAPHKDVNEWHMKTLGLTLK